MTSPLPLDQLLARYQTTDRDDPYLRWDLGAYLAHTPKAAADQLPFSSAYRRTVLRFYRAFPDRSWLDRRLCWAHYRVLLRLPTLAIRRFYLGHAARYGWTARQLTRQIKTRYYERTRLASPFGIKAHYVFDFVRAGTGPLSEGALETQLTAQLADLLLELGPDFSFVARQKLISLPGGQRYFVDLVFYHITRRRHLLVELKTTPLTHRDVGQLDTYVRLFDRHYRPAGDEPAIGLLLCPEFTPDLLHFSALADRENLLVASYEWAEEKSELLKK